MQVEGKAALITGGGTGVGRACALALAQLGCHVAVNYSRSKQEAEKTAEEAQARGVRAVALRADVSDDEEARGLIDQTERALGRLDILINSAGTTRFIEHADLEGVKDEDWDQILAVNLKGPFHCMRAARRLLEASGDGEVVSISSVAGVAGVGSSIPYAASKAALNNLTVTMARVLAPDVRVNAVAPGAIQGRWLQEGLGQGYEPIMSRIARTVPLQKTSTPEDVALAVLGLITGSDLVTGQVLVCDGGMLIRS